MSGARSTYQTATHRGTYSADVQDGRVVALHPVGHDRDPSPIGHSVASTVQGPLRVAEPMVRAGWLERRHRSDTIRRGAEPFVPVPPRDTLDVRGNPNVPTLDKGTSRLAQGPSAHTCLVEIERLAGAPLPVRVFEPRPIRRRND